MYFFRSFEVENRKKLRAGEKRVWTTGGRDNFVRKTLFRFVDSKGVIYREITLLVKCVHPP